MTTVSTEIIGRDACGKAVELFLCGDGLYRCEESLTARWLAWKTRAGAIASIKRSAAKVAESFPNGSAQVEWLA